MRIETLHPGRGVLNINPAGPSRFFPSAAPMSFKLILADMARFYNPPALQPGSNAGAGHARQGGRCSLIGFPGCLAMSGGLVYQMFQSVSSEES
jgi:hypothetical protein